MSFWRVKDIPSNWVVPIVYNFGSCLSGSKIVNGHTTLSFARLFKLHAIYTLNYNESRSYLRWNELHCLPYRLNRPKTRKKIRKCEREGRKKKNICFIG